MSEFYGDDEENEKVVQLKPKKPKKKLKALAKVKTKKVVKPKAKKYAVKGSFVVSPEGAVVSKTKSIVNVARGRKDKSNEYTVSFVVMAK